MTKRERERENDFGGILKRDKTRAKNKVKVVIFGVAIDAITIL